MIRKVNETDDLNKISHIYEESWKSAYKGMLPQDYLDHIPEGHWVENLTAKERHSLVMIEDDQMIGTSSYAPSRLSRLEGFGEIISIYMLPDYIGKGYGKQLLHETIKCLKEEGYHDLYLWVLEENTHARKFYEHAGFIQSDDIIEDVIGGKVVHEVRYQYHIDGGNDVRL